MKFANQELSLKRKTEKTLNSGIKAMDEETENSRRNHMLDLTQLPEGKIAIGCKWIYRLRPKLTSMDK